MSRRRSSPAAAAACGCKQAASMPSFSSVLLSLMFRQRLYSFICIRDDTQGWARLYHRCMLVLIFVGLIPLLFKQEHELFLWTDAAVAFMFIVDYILRWLTADLRNPKRGILAFFLYPFTLPAIVDLLSILPTITVLNNSLRLFRLSRAIRILRLISVFRMSHHSRNMRLVLQTILEAKDSLIAVCYLSVGYILLSALLIFNLEPDTFPSFFDAIYWATVSLTTVGYGDIYPTTTIGRIIAMFSSFCGIALIALPAGIITAGYMNAIQTKIERNH